ncbi:MAG: hypothetical protein VXW15_13975, partial [Bdellovibrionota bacterium]|nr:hypothetical protein [Bdellovibrionota bacterium]
STNPSRATLRRGFCFLGFLLGDGPFGEGDAIFTKPSVPLTSFSSFFSFSLYKATVSEDRI